MQTKILAAMCRSKEAHDLVAPHVAERELGPHGVVVARHVASYYDRDPDAECVDYELLKNSINRTLKNPKHEKMFDHIINQIEGIGELSETNVVAHVLEAKQHAVGMDLSAALAGSDDKRVVTLMEEYTELRDATSLTEEKASFNDITVADLFNDHLDESQKIKIAPSVLNDHLNGGLLRGQHLVLFARPEMGKSAMCCTMIWGFLGQGLRVLYVTNEDLPPTLAARAMSSLTGLTEPQIRDNQDEAQRRLDKLNWGNLFIEELVPGTVRELRNLVAKIKPDVLLVDQLRNIVTGEEGKVTQLEEAAKGVRNIGKFLNCLVISVTQAGDSASDRLTLRDSDIDSSKTGIPGACDVLVGMGADDNYKLAGMRRLSLCKNKTGGGHGHIDCEFIEVLSRLK